MKVFRLVYPVRDRMAVDITERMNDLSASGYVYEGTFRTLSQGFNTSEHDVLIFSKEEGEKPVPEDRSVIDGVITTLRTMAKSDPSGFVRLVDAVRAGETPSSMYTSLAGERSDLYQPVYPLSAIAMEAIRRYVTGDGLDMKIEYRQEVPDEND